MKKLFMIQFFIVMIMSLATTAFAVPIISLTLVDSDISIGESFEVQVWVDKNDIEGVGFLNGWNWIVQ